MGARCVEPGLAPLVQSAGPTCCTAREAFFRAHSDGRILDLWPWAVPCARPSLARRTTASVHTHQHTPDSVPCMSYRTSRVAAGPSVSECVQCHETGRGAIPLAGVHTVVWPGPRGARPSHEPRERARARPRRAELCGLLCAWGNKRDETERDGTAWCGARRARCAAGRAGGVGGRPVTANLGFLCWVGRAWGPVAIIVDGDNGRGGMCQPPGLMMTPPNGLDGGAGYAARARARSAGS